MEDVLDLYAEPYDPHHPIVCFDETPYQLISEVRQPLPGEEGEPQRYDYEYRREGTCNLFVYFCQQVGWRHVKVTERRTKQDFAHCMRDLVDTHFPDAQVIRVVMDNLNTHSPAALYETFKPAEARRILRKRNVSRIVRQLWSRIREHNQLPGLRRLVDPHLRG